MGYVLTKSDVKVGGAGDTVRRDTDQTSLAPLTPREEMVLAKSPGELRPCSAQAWAGLHAFWDLRPAGCCGTAAHLAGRRTHPQSSQLASPPDKAPPTVLALLCVSLLGATGHPCQTPGLTTHLELLFHSSKMLVSFV